MQQTVTLEEVGAAFDALLEVMARECSPLEFQTTLFAKEDVMQILAGVWVAPTQALVAADAGEVEW